MSAEDQARAEAAWRQLYPDGAIHLVSADGRVVKRYETIRYFGRIQYKGRWYAAPRLRAAPNAGEQIIYREETHGH